MSAALIIRRVGLQKFAATELRVWDCLAGDGAIWTALDAEFLVAGYTPMAQKPILPGCIAADGLAVAHLQLFPVDSFNVIDLHGDRDPLPAWVHLAGRLRHETLIFLRVPHDCRVSRDTLALAGIDPAWEAPVDKACRRYVFQETFARGCAVMGVAWLARLRDETATHYAVLTKKEIALEPATVVQVTLNKEAVMTGTKS